MFQKPTRISKRIEIFDKIEKNKINNPDQYDEVPLWWGDYKHVIKIPKPISLQVDTNKFSSQNMYRTFKKDDVYRPETLDLLMID